jgi:GNAT superfamily N-acetyltransferase
MRIRTYRLGDIPTLVQIQQKVARVDGLEAMSEMELKQLLAQPEMRTGYYAFLITDDDDELNTWGQGETLEGVEGEVVGYAILQLRRDRQAYHFYSHGAVLPEHRQRGAGHALLLCALNHARMKSIDIMAEARQRGMPIYFEVVLPVKDPTTERLVNMFELEEADEVLQPGLRLYRTEL